jgi:hypothetical protein
MKIQKNKKTPLPGQGPYNPPPPYKWIEAKAKQFPENNKKELDFLKGITQSFQSRMIILSW